MVDVYDVGTGVWTATVLSTARQGHAAASAGLFAFFGGGLSSVGVSHLLLLMCLMAQLVVGPQSHFPQLEVVWWQQVLEML